MDRDQDYGGRQIVGMDLHRHRSVIVRMTETGERLGRVRFDNSPQELAAQIAQAGLNPRVVLEATYGWYWAADTLSEAGAEVHLAHPLGVKMFSLRRVKTDERDAADLADLLRMGRLPEAWIAPPAIRDLRELARYRHKLVGLRTCLKDQGAAVIAKAGLRVPASDLYGRHGRTWLHAQDLGEVYRLRITSLLDLIDTLSAHIGELDSALLDRLGRDRRYQAVRTIPGIGPVFAALLVAEIGDVTRFPGPAQLCSWAGMTPKHHQSDTKTRRGRITKQGNPLVRWACVEAVQRMRCDSPMRALATRIIETRGKQAGHVAKVAAARKLLTLVYYAMRDGEVRCLAKADAA
ncbi:IS110 family transposase [Streptomyces sp. NPDC057746]|uniref:IS110 family transposase n=1 Tax=Streptomyces sp. NPDC057746 TaxID=3346237 RepID=UPI0036AE1CEB